MRLHLDSGHHISNAKEMKLAIESCGGVRGVATVVCGPLTIPDPNPFPKWDGVSLLNDNVLLGRDEGLEGVLCWRGQSRPLQQPPP